MVDPIQKQEFYVRCAFGLEKLVGAELVALGIKNPRPLSGGVAFFGSLTQAYRACLWLRSASRVLKVINRFNATDSNELYSGIQQTDWSQHISASGSLAVFVRGVNAQLKNTQFTAQRVKDAICDQLKAASGHRPSVKTDKPDVAIELSLRGNKASLYIDLCGEPLHKRGYRPDGVTGVAPLKENLAAAIVMLSGFDNNSLPPMLLDPMCGSGTILIEATFIAVDRAPGLTRDYWGFYGWLGHDQDAWNELLDEADRRFERALTPSDKNDCLQPVQFVGFDKDAKIIKLAQDNAKRAGVDRLICFEPVELSKAYTAICTSTANGIVPDGAMIISNPPYAKRLLEQAELKPLYEKLTALLECLPTTLSLHLISSDVADLSTLVGQPDSCDKLYNGPIEAQLLHYYRNESATHLLEVMPIDGSRAVTLKLLEPTSEQFAARFRKVALQRAKWARHEGISIYRVYDRDLPDYAVAIDCYQGVRNGREQSYYCVAEYTAPKDIDTIKAARRMLDVEQLLPSILATDSDHIVCKRREQSRGGEQYSAPENTSFKLLGYENGLKFGLDLGAHLDTGLFLDQRLTRQLIRSKAKDKRFLNLFAYTGAVTVYAASGGARQTCTLDMSNTYIEWAKNNMRINGFSGPEHRFIRTDVLTWLDELKANNADDMRFDLIFIDPPTFSNSKKMAVASWMVQRDHAMLIQAAFTLLAPGGELIFSCNLRSFKLDFDTLAAAKICAEDITVSTIPEDFERNPKVHHCFRLTRKSCDNA